MNPQGTFTATLIDRAKRALARGAAYRLQEGPHAAALASAGVEAVIADAEVRLAHLSEALACGRPEVMELDLAWLASTYAARGADAQLLRAVLQALADELTESLPADSALLARETLTRALATLDSHVTPQVELLETKRPHAQLAQRFLLAALEGRKHDAETMALEALSGGVPLRELHLDLLLAVQTAMGAMWQRGEISIAEEHLASRIVEDTLALLHNRMERAASVGRCVLVACVDGNLHDIGARMVSGQFELAGWRSVFLGANTPGQDLARAATAFEVDAAALSVGLALNVRGTAAAIQLLREVKPELPILVGGLPFQTIPDLWRDVGADGTAANGDEAVQLATRLLDERG